MEPLIRNTFVIAQKEFADNLWSKRFILLISTFVLILFSISYRNSLNGLKIFENGFLDVAQIIAVFLPLLGISLGFDSIVKDKKSSSLNVLLTHPMHRDNFVMGKILGEMVTLVLVVCISVLVSVGTILLVSGTQVTLTELNRVLIFTVLTYLYLSFFLLLGILTSIVSSNAANSLGYGICTWLILCVVFGGFIVVAAITITGQSFFDYGNNENMLALNAQLQKLTPVHYYSELVTGHPGITWGGVSIGNTNAVNGIFDISHTLDQWFGEYWTNIVILLSAPLILLIISVLTFLKQDINN
jgi:ABC-2 type transport system permease protein